MREWAQREEVPPSTCTGNFEMLKSLNNASEPISIAGLCV